ncbi:MAG TPA: metalloregulator ArsR/SmtB family transcription factor [Xanthobacteraceae bacterium]|nr:metalloregulator ArsR/SmtB family transcription factor [Xanthobacteraceae bacterium]
MTTPLRLVRPDDEQSREDVLLDEVFAALADPVRRAILTRLDGRDLLVSELAEPFDISLQAVSRHIQVLVRAGLVTQERTGRISRCRLDAGPIQTAAVWLNRYSKYWQEQFNVLAAALEEIAPAPTRPAQRRQPSRRGSARRKPSKPSSAKS